MTVEINWWRILYEILSLNNYNSNIDLVVCDYQDKPQKLRSNNSLSFDKLK